MGAGGPNSQTWKRYMHQVKERAHALDGGRKTQGPFLRAALYERISTEEQQEGYSIQEQSIANRHFAESKGWIVIGEYVDEGHSGSKDCRPALNELMADAAKGCVDTVACWRFDRFARSVRHLVIALDEFRARGVDFVSLHDGIDTSTPAGRFTFHVIAAVAELERELIRERTRAGIAAARRRGKHPGRPRVYVDVRRARALRAQGRSLREVAALLGVAATTLRRALQGAPKPSAESPAQPSEIAAAE